jgi:hypothetical protein
VAITDPLAVEVELPPFFEATSVFVRMLLSSVAMTSTFLFVALGVLMFPNRTFAPPPCLSQVSVLGSKLPAEQTTVGIRYAFENEPRPDPDDFANAMPGLNSNSAMADSVIDLVRTHRFAYAGIPVTSLVVTTFRVD